MRAKLINRTIQSVVLRDKPYDIRDIDLSGFLLRVSPSGAMNYYCSFRRPDKRTTRIKLGDAKVLTPAQARDEAHKILGDLARGQDPAAERRTARQTTLAVFIEKEYKPWVLSHRKSGEQTLRTASTQFAEFKNLRLSEISPWKLEKWRSQRLKSGTAPATVNRNVTVIKAILQKAVEWGSLEFNPLAKIRPLKTDSAANVRYLELQEETDLRSTLDQREARIREERRTHNDWCLVRGYEGWPDLDLVRFADYLKPMVIISLNTGVRRGELFSLKWSDVDLSRRTITINGVTAKSGKTRHIPLNNEALEALQSWKLQSTGTDGLVFCNKDGHEFDNVTTSWQSLLKLARISDFRWHDMRHHFASSLVMLGVDLNTVRELLGHGDLKMTLRYAHLAPQVKADAVAKLDRVKVSLKIVGL